jgi:hypothetical protein
LDKAAYEKKNGQVRRVGWARNIARMGKRNACRILVAMPERKRPQGSPRHRCVDNIKMDLRELGWGGMDWVDVTQDSGRRRTLCEH